VPPTESDIIEYETWQIDPAHAPPAEPETLTSQASQPQSQSSTQELPPIAVPPERSLRPLELFSMAAVVGLILGSFVVGTTMYSGSVLCKVRSARAGLVVMADGRDSGARTVEGEVPLRLPPGRHQIGLAEARKKTLLGDPRALEVRPGEACMVAFEDNVGGDLDEVAPANPAVANPAPAENAH
jgi:hypothetical protein